MEQAHAKDVTYDTEIWPLWNQSDKLVTYILLPQVPVDPTTEQASADFTDQMNQVVKNMVSVLKTKRLTLQHIVNVRVYLTDMTKFEQMNEIFAEHFSRHWT